MSAFKAQIIFIFSIVTLVPIVAMNDKPDKQELICNKRSHHEQEETAITQDSNKKIKIELAANASTAIAIIPKRSKWLTQEARIVDLRKQNELSQEVFEYIQKTTGLPMASHNICTEKSCREYEERFASEHISHINALILQGARLSNEYGHKALMMARKKYMVRVAIFLKKNGAPESLQEIALSSSDQTLINATTPEDIKTSLEQGADPDSNTAGEVLLAPKLAPKLETLVAFTPEKITPTDRETDRSDRLMCAKILLEYGANPNAYFDDPLLLQLTKEEDQGELASLLLEHNADAVIPEEPLDSTQAIIYPQHTVYSYAVGKPGLLDAFKKRHQELAVAIMSNPVWPKECAELIAQYIIPVETGLIDQIHYAEAQAIEKIFSGRTEERAKALLTALALRYFTQNQTTKDSLTAIARTLLTTDNANFTYINEQRKQVGPALHIAVLSDEEDDEYYSNPQEAQKETGATSAAAAVKPSSIIQDLISHGANEQTTDATGKTALQHAKQYLTPPLTPPALTRQHATARSAMLGWMMS